MIDLAAAMFALIFAVKGKTAWEKQKEFIHEGYFGRSRCLSAKLFQH